MSDHRDAKVRYLLDRHIVEGAERDEMTASTSWWERFYDIVGTDSDEVLDDIERDMNIEFAEWWESDDE